MKTHQICHFVNGEKRTFFNVVGVKDNEFTHLKLEDGRKILINKDNVLMVEVFQDGEIAEKTWGEMFGVYSANEGGSMVIDSCIVGTGHEDGGEGFCKYCGTRMPLRHSK